MDSFVIWTASWGVIMIIDFFVLNRGRPDVPALYESRQRSRYGDVRWRSLFALLVGLVSGWAFPYGGVSLFQGPISRATGGVDFSWLASIVFGGWRTGCAQRALAWPRGTATRSWPRDRSAMNRDARPKVKAGVGPRVVRASHSPNMRTSPASTVRPLCRRRHSCVNRRARLRLGSRGRRGTSAQRGLGSRPGERGGPDGPTTRPLSRVQISGQITSLPHTQRSAKGRWPQHHAATA